jgi:two-component system, chemotaxis family, CheB/CheR fusion protein
MSLRVDPEGRASEGASPAEPANTVRAQLSATERLVEVAQDLSMARDLAAIMAVVRRAARELTGADGATFVLRDGDLCFYADEDAINPLWKGRRFPMATCISGWSMLNKAAAIIEDVYDDPRIPQDAYRPTFVKSLAMVPIRTAAPVGAIGNYWARPHGATDGEVKLLRALADLTSLAMENVQLYEELQKRIAEAQDAVRAREEFITVAAHELRTPLTALQLQLQSLAALAERGEGSSDGRLAERAARAVSGARRLGALVDGLLDAARVEHGTITLTLEALDLAETTREVVERFRAPARRAGCEIVMDAARVQGRWDRLRVEQVVTHLLSNAIKYGSGKPVGVLVEELGEGARLEVRDCGVGISPEISARIFERFARSGSVTHYGGLGLGLYLARQVVEAHGGTIAFYSRPGDGCTFVVDLPKAPPARAPEAERVE